jgi:hypothetical protein
MIRLNKHRWSLVICKLHLGWSLRTNNKVWLGNKFFRNLILSLFLLRVTTMSSRVETLIIQLLMLVKCTALCSIDICRNDFKFFECVQQFVPTFFIPLLLDKISSIHPLKRFIKNISLKIMFMIIKCPIVQCSRVYIHDM